MKILLCTGIFPPEKGGPATYTSLITEAFTVRGHDVVVVTYVGKKSKIQNPKSKIIQIKRSWFKPWHYYKYFRAVKKYGKEFDVLYAQDPVSAGYPTYLAAKVLKKPLVVKITGDYSWEQAMGRGLTKVLIDDFQKLTSYLPPIRKIRNIQIQVAKSAHKVVVPSEYLNKLVMGWGVKEKQISIIYNSADPRNRFPREESRKELNFSPADFVVLSIGRDVPWKGFDLLREAVRELNEPNLKLVILNTADRETTDKHLAAADLFVLNTGYEGFSHTIIEAVSAGLPVITTNVGGNPEIIQNGTTGLLVEYNDKEGLKNSIKKLYNDPSLREKLISNSVSILEKFSIKNMVDQTEELLKKCVS